MELISREEAIKALQKWNCRDSVSLTINPYEVLRDIPTIEERKEGKWIHHTKTHDVCSVCGTGTQTRIFSMDELAIMSETIYRYDYCPHCGAKMKGE